MSSTVEIEGLTKRYGSTTALDDLSVTVPAGRVLSVLGPSGCGKSTLLRIVAGLTEADAGTVTLGGMTVVDGPRSIPPERRPLNLVFQDYALWPHLRVRDNVGYGLFRRSRRERRARVEELLELFRIGHLADRFPAQLSGGQQQRVAIARALATEPSLLLFDEPLSNLDVQLRSAMRDELAEILANVDTAAIYVTHDAVEACVLADDVVVLREGRAVQQGSPEDLFNGPHDEWVAALAGLSTVLPGRTCAPPTDVTDGVDASVQWVSVGGRAVAARSPGGRIPDGDEVRVLIHPDDVRLTGGGAGHANGAAHDGSAVPAVGTTLVGEVEHVTFEGRRWRVRLVLGDGTRLNVSATAPIERGSSITVSLAPGSALAFPVGH